MTVVGSLAPLRYAPFRWLLTGRTVSVFGSSIAPIALAFSVLDLTGSVSDLGVVVGARALATLAFVLAGGVIADRLPRHRVMVMAATLAAVSQAMLAVLIITGSATIPLLVVLAFANGMAGAFALPAAAALLPQTVPPQIRQHANGLSRLGFNGAMVSGSAAGGVLVTLSGPGWGLAVNAATFTAAAVCFALVRVAATRDKSAPPRDVLRELREGWTEFVGHSWLRRVVAASMIINAVFHGSVMVLGPAVADQTIGRGAWGLVLAAWAAGMALGAVIAMRLRVRRLLLAGVTGMFLNVPLMLGLALTPQALLLLAAAALLAGIAIGQFGVAWETTMQEHIPPEKLARVYSYDLLGGLLAVPAGQVAAGPVADAIGTGPALLCAAGILALAVGAMVGHNDVRRVEHRPLASTAQ
ncbi:arabinose efflux permease family protein [Saccharomonospora marina XMU15]|uniref:Arabinose efflux permease family protein n=1 Tax=Saccharomonospora marina XMU15 TaxID=882083 RepID=H5X7R1_9PSEU|nr:MFS transporter [Saccharomonospora marina]EHR51354.1 arabinose efflux permease family protein [Saccharomonospora marina XMU15]